MPFRAVFVHCKELNKGFVTCLLRDDRLAKLYGILSVKRPYLLRDLFRTSGGRDFEGLSI